MPGAKVLVVEDEGIEALDLQHRLMSLGYAAPDIASTGEEAVKMAEETSPDLVLMDIMLSGEIDGVTAAEQIQARLDIPFIYITAYADEDTLRRAKVTEPYAYIVKPFKERELHITIDMALYKHRMEKKLKESEKWLATTLRSIGDGVIATDKSGLITFMNPVAEGLTGWKLEEVLNKKLTEVFNIINRDTRQPAENPVTRAILEGTIVGLANHTRLITRDGTEIPIDDSAAPIKDDKENLIGVVLVFRDVTEHEKAEDALRHSKEQWEQTFDTVPDLVAILDHQHRIVRVNRAMADRLGVTPDQCIGRRCYEAVHGMPETPGFCPHSLTCQDGQQHVAEVHEPRLGGDFLVSTTPLSDPRGQLIGAVHVARDITERKAAEQKLQRQTLELRRLTETLEQRVQERTAELARANELLERDIAERKRAEEDRLRLSAAVEQTSESVAMADFQAAVEYVNPAFEVINGYPKGEVLGRTYFDFLEGDPRGIEMRHAFSQGRQWKGHLERKRKDGEVRNLDVVVSPVKDQSGKILNYLIAERDVTQEIKTQQHMRQMQKMESLGMLAGGIAHDFNNMLSTIVINTEMTLLDLGPNSPSHGALSLVLGAADRGKELVKQIITFSRQKEQNRRPMKISPILKETLKFLRSSLPRNIEIREDIETKSDIVQADPTQIHQVLMNLCTNAAHAMREQGGVLEVKLRPLVVDSRMVADHPELKPGPCLTLTVRDTGRGMTREVMERIFDPFFTTKKAGEGSGMGLAVVYGIVKSYGGCITVHSEVGQGSAFNVFVPHIVGEPEPARISPKILRGSERIFLVEDEEVQLRSFQNMLERLGYRVAARADSLEALADFEKDPHRFDLVITDQTMPKMTGVKLAEAFLRIRPDIPIILCTGFSETVTGEEAKLKGIREFVMKPFSVREMSEAIRRVLGAKD